MEDNQPRGIGFFNIKSGETHYAQLEPQIQGFINSSDMGINASRGQDFGWRLEPEWVKKVKAFRKDETKMEALISRNSGQAPTTTQILYTIYGAQLRAAQQIAKEGEAPFEESYLQQISNRSLTDEPEEPADNFDSVASEEEPVVEKPKTNKK